MTSDKLTRDPKSTHYRLGPPLEDFEVADVVDAVLNRMPATVSHAEAHHLASIIEYACRYGRKGDRKREAEKLWHRAAMLMEAAG